MRLPLFVAVLLASCTRAPSSAAEKDPFRGARGCFLVHETGTKDTTEIGGDECGARTVPASTFKIPNALIGLDARVVRDENHRFEWDGKPRWNKQWNRDHTLATAMRHSVLWYFQRIATEVGTERYKSYLSKLAYGNADPSGDVTMFWLDGPLVVSPREQARFLESLYTDKLPFDARATTIVKQTIVLSGEAARDVRDRFPFLDALPNDVVFSGKTGSNQEARRPDGTLESIGWFVGSFARGDRRWVFACRIRSQDKNRGGADAARIAYELMHEKGLF